MQTPGDTNRISRRQTTPLRLQWGVADRLNKTLGLDGIAWHQTGIGGDQELIRLYRNQ
jgi:hypothetical protein